MRATRQGHGTLGAGPLQVPMGDTQRQGDGKEPGGVSGGQLAWLGSVTKEKGKAREREAQDQIPHTLAGHSPPCQGDRDPREGLSSRVTTQGHKDRCAATDRLGAVGMPT